MDKSRSQNLGRDTGVSPVRAVSIAKAPAFADSSDSSSLSRGRDGHVTAHSGSPSKQFLIAILAAGASRRLGLPKQLVMLHEEPLLRRQCRVALSARLGPVVAILGCHYGACVASISDLPVAIRRNEQWSEGIGSSIRVAASAAIDAQARGLLILHCDQYRISADDLRSLHSAWVTAGLAPACRAAHDRYTGPPVLFPSKLFPALLEMAGDEGARRVLASLPKEDLLDVAMPRAIDDLDLPEQIEELSAR